MSRRGPDDEGFWSDGARIALALFRLFRSFSPSRFFGTFALLAAAVAVLFLSGVFGDGFGADRADMGLAFATLAWRYIPLLLRPRIDGREH